MSSKQNILYHIDGLDAAQTKDWLKAIAIFQEIEPPSAQILFNIGCCRFNAKKYAEAEQSFQQCIVKDKYLAVAFYQLAITQAYLEKMAESVKSFYSCTKAMRNNAFIDYKQLNMKCKIYECDALYNIAMVYIFCQDFTLGESYMKEALDVAKDNDKCRFISTSLNAIQRNNWDYFGNLGSLASHLILIGEDCLFAPSKAMREGVEAGAKMKIQSAEVLVADNDTYAFVGFVGARKIQKNVNANVATSAPTMSQYPNPVPPPPSKSAFSIPPMPAKPPPMPGKAPPRPAAQSPVIPKKIPPPRPPPSIPKSPKYPSSDNATASVPLKKPPFAQPPTFLSKNNPIKTSVPARPIPQNLAPVKPPMVFNKNMVKDSRLNQFGKNTALSKVSNKKIKCNITLSIEMDEKEMYLYNNFIKHLKEKFSFISENMSTPLKTVKLHSKGGHLIDSFKWGSTYKEALKDQLCDLNLCLLNEEVAHDNFTEDVYSDDLMTANGNAAYNIQNQQHFAESDKDDIYSGHVQPASSVVLYDDDDNDIYAESVGNI